MIRTFLATSAIMTSELLLFAAFAGVGLGVRRLLGHRTLDADSALMAFWSGLATIILFLLLVNFAFPVHDVLLLLVVLAGAVSLWSWRSQIGALLRPVVRENRRAVACFAIVAFWIANLSLGPLLNWDSELYHLPAVSWAEQHPVVPGIANLYGPLAFNNASFLYGALLNAGPWQDRAFLLTNGVLVLGIILRALVSIWRLHGGRSPDPFVDFFALLLAVPAFVIATPDTLPSYVTDTPTTLVLLAAMPLIVQEFRRAGGAEQREYRILVISMLLALGVCLKLHVGVFAALVWPMLLLHWTRDRQKNSLPWRAGLLRASAIVFLFAAAWTGRGIVQSGYPFFPLPHFGLPVDWRAPAEHAAAEQAFILHSGRFSSRQFGTEENIERLSGWAPRWWRNEVNRNPFELTIPVALALVAGLALSFRRRTQSGDRRVPFILLIPVSAGTLAWFLAAPSPRYATYLFWSAAALLGSAIILRWVASSATRRAAAIVACVALILSPALVMPPLRASRTGANPLAALVRQNLNRSPQDAFFPSPASRNHDTFVTATGLRLNVATDAVGQRCGAIPIPCTPNPADNLALRRPPDLRHGFRVDGEWRMQGWPYLSLPNFLETWRNSRGSGPSNSRPD